MTVSDASQLCAAKRTDCVLVVDQEEGLSGIFTAKDLAFRVSFPFLSLLSFRLHFLPLPTTIADIYDMDFWILLLP
jgi:CBS domain-containing protein